MLNYRIKLDNVTVESKKMTFVGLLDYNIRMQHFNVIIWYCNVQILHFGITKLYLNFRTCHLEIECDIMTS